MNIQQILLAGPYNLLYACAFGAAFGLAHWHGTRAGLPARQLALFLICCAAAGVLGSRFLPFDLSSVEVGEKTVLGGVFAVCVAALAARVVLRLDARYTDALALALPLGFAIGRIGCFLAGCCAGTVTDLPWGVRFAADADAVHPTQLYEAAGALLIALGAQQRLRRQRDILIPGVVLPYLALRFVLQFLREHNGGGFGTTHVMLLLCAGLLWAAHAFVQRCRRTSASENAWLYATGAAACMAFLAARALTPLEALTLTSLAFLGGVLIVTRMSRSALRALPAFASVIALQQVDTTTSYRYLTLGGGATGGRYQESCGGAHRYAMGGASIGYTSVLRPNEQWSARARVFAGRDRERFVSPSTPEMNIDTSLSVAGGSLALSGQSKWVGGTIGFVAGDLLFDGERQQILPVVGVRLGPPPFFVEGRYADFDPAPVPAPILQLGVGTRISPRGSELRFGISDVGVYANVLVVAGAWEIEPRVALGEENTHQLGLSLRRRIALKPSGNR